MLSRCVRVAAGWAAAMTFVVAGCSRTSHWIPDAAPAYPPELYEDPDKPGLAEMRVDRPPYRLAPGDVIEIIYHVKNVPTPGGYQLKIEDMIRIQFPYQADFDQRLVVSGDGRVRCLLVGDVHCSGLTAAQIEENLKKAYTQFMREPELTVTVEAANVKINELKKAITTAPRGQSRLVPVKPDGTIDLPYVGELMAAGKTVREVKQLLDTLYVAGDLPEIEVTVQLLEFSLKRVFVMGEVLAPGVVESRTPLTMVQAMISAGGPNVRADKARCLLIRRENLPVPEAVVVNLDDLLSGWRPGPDGRGPDGSRFRYDMYVANGDIIYVPPTGLAQATDWIDQVFTRGIRSVFPYSGNVGLNFGYDIRSAPITVTNRSVGPPSFNTQIGP